jgi:hypothetical protein
MAQACSMAALSWVYTILGGPKKVAQLGASMCDPVCPKSVCT